MTYKCREFYCTKTWSLVRPQCLYGITAGTKALEIVTTTEQDPLTVGQ